MKLRIEDRFGRKLEEHLNCQLNDFTNLQIITKIQINDLDGI